MRRKKAASAGDMARRFEDGLGILPITSIALVGSAGAGLLALWPGMRSHSRPARTP